MVLFLFVIMNISLVVDANTYLESTSNEEDVDTIIKVGIANGRRFLIHVKRNSADSYIEIVPRGYVKCLDTFVVRGTGILNDFYVTDLNKDGNKELLIETIGPGKYPLKEIWGFETLENNFVREIKVEKKDFVFISNNESKDISELYVNRFNFRNGVLKETHAIYLSLNHYWVPNHFVSRQYLLKSDSTEARMIPIRIN